MPDYIDEHDSDDEILYEVADAPVDDRERTGAVAGWGVSLALHAAVVLILGLVVVVSQIVEYPVPVRVSQVIPEPPQDIPDNPTLPPEVEPVPMEVPVDPTIDSKVMTIEMDPIEPSEESPDPVADEAAERPSELDSSAVSANNMPMMAIGAGESGGSGPFADRVGPGKKKAIGSGYGPWGRPVADDVEAGLVWLMRHQSIDGKWDSDAYWTNCTDGGAKGEPGNDVNGADEALTGYAVLAFLGWGYDHRTPNRFRRTVKAGIDWMVANQKPDGLIGNRNYEHAVCAMALAEAYAMTNDGDLREPAQRAVDVILARQAESDGYPLAWDYTKPKPERIDTSVSGWNVMALKSAKAAGLDVGQGLEGSKQWLERAWADANPGFVASDPYTDRSVFPYTWNASTGETKKDHLSFAGAVVAVFLGHGAGDDMLETMLNDMTARWLDTGKYKTNSYALYYASMAAFQGGPRSWKPWMEQYVPYLHDTQIKDAGCMYGTWNYPKQDFHGGDTSRVLIHCYQLLALEVAVRYRRQ